MRSAQSSVTPPAGAGFGDVDNNYTESNYTYDTNNLSPDWKSTFTADCNFRQYHLNPSDDYSFLKDFNMESDKLKRTYGKSDFISERFSFAKPFEPMSVESARDEKSQLTLKLRELKKISNSNENRISKLLKKLNSLKLSLTLLKEEQQRLEHSRQVRTVNIDLLLNMLKKRYNSEEKIRKNQLQCEKAIKIVEQIFNRFNRMEELKMKLEYENTRKLYAIKDIKNDIMKLEKTGKDLSKKFNHCDDNLYGNECSLQYYI